MKNMITFDFETYYDTNFTLKKLSYTDYIYHDLFKVHGAAVKINNNESYWLTHADIPDFLKEHTKDTFVVHNGHFDIAVLSLYYYFMPAAVMDTKLIANLLVGWRTRLSLENLAEYFNCPLKKGKVLGDSKGVRVLSDVVGLEESIAHYSCTDVEITFWLLQHLLKNAHALYGIDKETLKKELKVMDLTLKLVKTPSQANESLYVNRPLLEEAVEIEKREELQKVHDMAATYNYSEHEFTKMLRSRTAFPKFIEKLGVKLPTKISKTTGKETYALAKNDTALLALREQLEGTDAGLLFDFREEIGSTIKRTRSERILNMALPIDEDTLEVTPIPVFLNYAGAQKTLRWSGGNKTNMQNLPRASVLRKALVPPPGYKIVVCDYSSVEARVLAYLAQDDDLLEVFRSGQDVYVNFGMKVWSNDMLIGSEDEEDSPLYKEFKKRRFVSKTCVLGLGYSASWYVLENTLRTGSMGAKVIIDQQTAESIGVERSIVINNLKSMKEWVLRDKVTGEARWAALMAPLQRDPSLLWHYGACMRLVEIYRGERWPVTNFWKAMEPKNLVVSEKVGYIDCWMNDDDLSIGLPGGSILVFPDIKIEKRGARFTRAGVPMHTYGAKIVENSSQGVGRNLLRDAWIEADQEDLHTAMTVHDELVCIEREDRAEEAAEKLTRIMSTPPAWAPDLPIDAEAKVIDTYADK